MTVGIKTEANVKLPCGDTDTVKTIVVPTVDPDTGEMVLDARSLPQPGPFVSILRHIEAAVSNTGDGGEFVVRLARDPIYLYPELVERGWTWERLPSPSGEVRLRLSPPDGGPPDSRAVR